MRADVVSACRDSASRSVGIGLLILTFAVLLSRGATADYVADGVPLPDDAKISALPSTAPPNHRRFVGAWIGAWEDAIRHVLIVESIRSNGEAQVIYAVGDNPWANIPGAWHRHTASVSGDVLKISTTFNAAYEARSWGRADRNLAAGKEPRSCQIVEDRPRSPDAWRSCSYRGARATSSF